MKANKSISVNIELSLGGTDVRLSHSVYPSLLMRMCSWSCRRDQGESLISAFKLGSPSTACMRAFAAVVNNLSAAEAPVPWFHMILFASSSPSLAALLYLHSSPFSSPSSSLCFSSSYPLMKEMALFFCWCCVARQQVAPTVAPLDLNMCQWVCVVVCLARKTMRLRFQFCCIYNETRLFISSNMSTISLLTHLAENLMFYYQSQLNM